MRIDFVLFLASTVCLCVNSKTAHAQMQVSKTLNDSVQYYMHIGQAKKAYFLLQRALIQKSIPENEQARAFFLMGKLKETEGYDEEAYSNYMRAGSLAVKQNLPALQAMSWSGAANVLVSLERLDSALLLCKISQVLDSTVKSKTANMLVMARYSQNKDQLDQAMGYFKQAAGLALSIKEKEMLGLAYSGIATIYYNQYTDMEQALHFFTKAVKAFDSLQSANIMAHTYVRIANVWMVRNNGQQANLYLERARRIVEISENMPTKAYLLSSLAIFKSEGGDLKEVVKYAEQALQIKRKLGQRRKILNDLLNLSIWYMELKQYSKSRNYLQEGIAISRELHDPIHFHYYYETMAQLDSVSGNLGSAFSNLKKAHLYKDSAYSLSKVKALEEISKKYENEQKEKTIAEKELVIEKQKYQLSIIVGISIISILSVLAFLFWRLSLSRSRFQKEQERQNTVRLQTIVNTQEAVQQRIARDIHDGLVQVMGAAKLSLQAVKIDGDRDIIQQRIREASVIIDEACTETRMLSHQILPYSLMKGGLLPALEELFKKSLMEIQFSFNHNVGEARFDQDIEINIYRVAQEIVQNIVKHSGATSVEANLTLEKKMLTLSIADNGKGFDKTTAHSNAGLTNISTRAQLIKATLFMNTQHGAGTKVQLQLEV